MLRKIGASFKPRSSNFMLNLCLIVGPFLVMIDSSVVNVALPGIASTYNGALTDVQWVISGYLLALAAVMVACAFLSKRFGASKVYLVSLAGFTLASLACAFAPSLQVLILFRALQGAFGAPLVPVAMDLLMGGYASGKRDVPVAFGIVVFLAPAIGPTVGGLLINYVGWPSVFLVNVPVGAVTALYLLRNNVISQADVVDRNIRFDLVGTAALSAGLVSVLYGSTQGASSGWLSMAALPFLAAGAALIIFYLAWARRAAKPAVDLKLVRNAGTALTLLLCTVAAVVMFGVLFLVPVIMQSVQGYSAMDAGLALLPQGIVTGVGVGVGDFVYRKKLLSIRTIVVTGMLLLAVSTVALLGFGLTTSIWVGAAILCFRAFAMSLTIQPLLFEMLATLTPQEMSDGNTLFNVTQRLSGSVGISALATVFQTQAAGYVAGALRGYPVNAGSMHIGQGASAISSLPGAVRDAVGTAVIHGFHDTVLILVGLSVLGLALALLLRDNRTKEATAIQSPAKSAHGLEL
ncbi:MAG TPA: DHA2 family efflux MFS transporter permease subunit [Methanocella sp.]|nr:DHA2 family efflux MFS transporter permease subunit [Methanocella sp.]